MSWEKLSRDLRFVAMFQDADGVRVGGLTVLADVYRVAVSGQTLIAGDALASEIGVGSGMYYYILDSSLVASPGMYIAVFKTADAGVAQKEVASAYLVGLADIANLDASVNSAAGFAQDAYNAASAAPANVWQRDPADHGHTTPYPTFGAAVLADPLESAVPGAYAAGQAGYAIGTPAAVADPLESAVPGAYAQGTAGYALGRIGRAKIEVNSPVSTSGILELTRGDDYAEADGRALSFISSAWPDLTGVTEVRLTVRKRAEAFRVGGSDDSWFTVTDKEASRVLGAGAQTLVFELTPTETAELEIAQGAERYAGKYDVQATLGGRIITLAVGVVKVVEDQTR